MLRSLRAVFPGKLDLLLVVGLIASATWYFAPGGTEQPRVHAAPAACREATPVTLGELMLVPLRLETSAQPAVGAPAAVAIDGATGRVLYSRGMHERRPPASTTKIMTAIVALETMRDENETVVSRTDATKMRGSSVMGLWTSARISYRDLLFGLMLPSGNDAALELAHNLAPTKEAFIDEMNAKARELGLRDTHFVNPHGLDHPEHYTTAYDLAMIARYAMQNQRFREIVGAQQHHLADPLGYDVYNGNSLLDSYPGAGGVKIGWTNRAGWTFVASAQRDGREVIVALLNTPDRDADAAALLDWSFASFTWREASRKTAPALRLFDVLGMPSGLERWMAACLPVSRDQVAR